MLGHRPLNAEDYLGILKRRWWLIAIPAIILPIVAFAVTFFIPPQYESQTLVLIDQQKVPDEFVRSVVSEDLNTRLASMKEQILSRSSLQPIIEHYDLYASQHLSMDDRISLARKGIGIVPIHSAIANSNGLPGFSISFTASDAHTAQQVCDEITSLFTGANVRSREEAAEGTTQFLKEQLDSAQRTLDDQDAKLAAFQQKNFGMLPGDETSNVNILGTLDTQLDAATQALNTMEQQKSYMEAMLAQQSQPPAASVVAIQSPQVQQTDLDKLLAEQVELTSHYTADNPDVKAINRKIADLRKQMANPSSIPAQTIPVPAGPRPTDSVAVQDLRAKLRALDLAIQDKHKAQEQIAQQIHSYQARVESSPQIQEEYKALTRGSQTAQTFYDATLANLEQSKMASDLEHRSEGEQFHVMDAANLPDSPNYPNRNLFALGGFAAGIGLGLLIVAFIEYKDTALRSERDIWAFTQLPTLAVIAWSGDVAHIKVSKRVRLKRLFSRKPPKDLLADAPG